MPVNGRREVGLGLQGDRAVGDYADLARAAEELGFDVLSVFGDLLYLPPLVVLLEMARATSRVRLGAACHNPYTVHPYEIASQTAALDAVSGGRAYVGLARGAWLGDIGVAQPRPVAHLGAAVALVRALLAGDDRGLADEIFPLAPGVRLRHALPRRPPPVLLGTWGPATAALAGRVADEVKIGGTANPAMVPVLRERIGVGTRAAGRAADEVGIVVGAVTVVDADGAAARDRARREVAMYLAVVADLDPTAHVDPAVLARVRALVAAGEDEAAGALVDDRVLDLFAFAGTPAEVADHADRVFRAGAARVEFGAPHGLTPATGLRLLGGQVLPRLRRPA